ncbi:uncharacterized protein LOC34620601 [Cyclospora cayetanensis]|uniref:Uncharacterized protein LOC34620601 n=1 Tax=Cyclospora cayetanensis TaxID=88456 RepID=A0A6P6RXA3_9EIME|nr:uncharacterized protein LOC34620601 [Cyclospora cayetanensis]
MPAATPGSRHSTAPTFASPAFVAPNSVSQDPLCAPLTLLFRSPLLSTPPLEHVVLYTPASRLPSPNHRASGRQRGQCRGRQSRRESWRCRGFWCSFPPPRDCETDHCGYHPAKCQGGSAAQLAEEPQGARARPQADRASPPRRCASPAATAEAPHVEAVLPALATTTAAAEKNPIDVTYLPEAKTAVAAAAAAAPGGTTREVVDPEVVFLLALQQNSELSLGASSAALRLLREAEQQFSAAYGSNQERSQPAQEEALRASRLAAAAAQLCRSLQAHIPSVPLPAVPEAAAAASPPPLPNVGLLTAQIAALEAMLQVELHHQKALLLLSSADERRAAISEVLWCVAALVTVLPHFFQPNQQQQQPGGYRSAAAAAVAEACPRLGQTLLQIADLALQGGDRVKQQQQLQEQQQQQLQEQQQGADTYMRKRLDTTGADGLMPTLQALAILCDARRVGTQWAEMLTQPLQGSPSPEAFKNCALIALLEQLVSRDDHRGVLQAALSVACNLAAGPPQTEDAAVVLLPQAAAILSSGNTYDIVREAAEMVLHLAFNNGCRHLQSVVAATPAVLPSYLDILDRCKVNHDLPTAIIALDYISAILEREPSARQEIYALDGIAKMESVQFLSNEALDRKVSWIISTYFDGFSDEEEEQSPASFNTFTASA